MIQFFVRLIGIITLCLMFTVVFFAQVKKTDSAGEHLITALIRSKNLPLFFRLDQGVLINPALEEDSGLPPEVKKILMLKEKAIPLLIEHLDDKRIFTHMTSCCSSTKTGVEPVTAAEGVLSILINIVRQERPMFSPKCIKEAKEQGDYENNCLETGYLVGQRGKRNWLKAYRAGKVKYEKYEY